MKATIRNQITGTLGVSIIFIISLLAAIMTKEIIWIIASSILGLLTLLFTLNSIKVIKKEKGIKLKHDINYGLCIGFIVLTTMFGVSIALFINNISYRINGIETTAVIYNIDKKTNYKTEYKDDGSSYQKKEEKCNVYIKYTVDNKEYKTKLNSGDCHYTMGDKVKIYYDREDPSKIESNSLFIILFTLLFTGFVFTLFIVKCIKSYSKPKKNKKLKKRVA